jgi:hypothetical protein
MHVELPLRSRQVVISQGYEATITATKPVIFDIRNSSQQQSPSFTRFLYDMNTLMDVISWKFLVLGIPKHRIPC